MNQNKTLTALNGVSVGHSTQADKLTGCTAIIFDKPMPVAYKSYGGAPGTFNTDSIRSQNTMYKENGIFIAGGSIPGLMSSTPIIESLRRDKIGASYGEGEKIYNPSIVGAIVFDLGMKVAPYEAKYGQEAYDNLSKDPVENGNVGAGTGTTSGKFWRIDQGRKNGAMKSGVGSAWIDMGGGITICALSVVNPLGNVTLPNGDILAGNRDEYKKFRTYEDLNNFVTDGSSNTTISVVGMNVNLKSKEHYEKVAHLASHGQIRAINPVNTSLDGDTVFVFSTEELEQPLNHNASYFKETESDIHFQTDLIGYRAAQAVQESIYDACRSAVSINLEDGWQGIIPSCNDYPAS